jgi:hypothetical protein
MTRHKILLLVTLIHLILLSSVAYASGEGFWRGFYQYSSAVRDGKDSPNEFDKNPIPLYLKLEQTKSTLVGVYSTKFGDDKFKSSPISDLQNVTGSINDQTINLILHSDNSFVISSPKKIRGKLKGNTISGEFTIIYDRVIYSGIVELEKY